MRYRVPVIMAGVIVVLIAIIIQTETVSGQIVNSTGRIYGNWRTRQIQRKCKHDLFCRYKDNDCMNYNNQNTWICNQINSDIATNNCVMKRCDEDNEMVCGSTPPSNEYMTVESDSCAKGLQCYMKRPTVTTTVLPAFTPTTTSAGSLPPRGGPVVQETTTMPSLLDLILTTTTTATTTTTDGGLLDLNI